MTTAIDIRPDHLELVQAILREHLPSDVKVWVFGSRANWTTKDSSDLDLALEGPDKIDRKVRGMLMDAFEDSDLPYTVDIVDMNQIGDNFRKILDAQKEAMPSSVKNMIADSEWRVLSLNQIGRIVTGRTPSSRKREYFGGHIPFITPSDFDGRRSIQVTKRYLTSTGRDAVAGAEIPSGAVLVSCIGSDMGKSAIALQPSVTNQQINSIIVNSEADPIFVYYNLSGRREEIRSAGAGSAVPILNKTNFGHLEIVLPPLSEQGAIAHVLGTLDDKIELNQRMNETLEEMARVIFKDWFIDFGPTRAKMEGMEPYLPSEVWDLFPDSLTDSEVGEIPEGWEVNSMGELAEVVGGSTPRTKEASFWDGGTYHFATPKDLSTLSDPVLLSTERRITKAGLSQISSGLLPIGTVLLSSRAPIGYLAIAEIPVAVNQGFIVIKPKRGISNLFLMYSIEALSDEITNRANGTTFLEISKRNFRPIPVVSPSSEVIGSFHDQVKPLYNRLVRNKIESQTLINLRDELLPKLMSGDIRVT